MSTHSAIVKTEVMTSETHSVKVIITAQRTKNDINGNARYLVQVWIDRNESFGGNLWSPIVKGYRNTKNDEYIITSRHIESDIFLFIQALEKAVQV